VPLTVLLIEIVLFITRRFPSLWTSAAMCMLTMVVWVLMWVICLFAVVWTLNDEGHGYWGEVFLLVFSFYWTVQVIRNLLHATVAGVVGSWFFYSDDAMSPSPTWNSFKRAATTSLGSIAFGSMLVAIIDTIKFILDQMIRNTCLRYVVDCLCTCIQDLLAYFNFYAYIFVALYGDSFCEAGKKVWDLVGKSEMWTMIINDDLVGWVCIFGGLLGGLESGLVAALISYLAFDSQYWLTWFFIAFLVGFAITLTALTVIQSAVSTMYLCYIQEPDLLKRTHPPQGLDLAKVMRKIYNRERNQGCCGC